MTSVLVETGLLYLVVEKTEDDSIIVSLLQENESKHGLVVEDFLHLCDSCDLPPN